MKSYTDLEQSKKLAGILPLESADMCYSNDGTAIKIDANPYTVRYSMWKDCVSEIIPCWSLEALLEAMPKSIPKYMESERCQKTFHLNLFRSYYHCCSYSFAPSISDDDGSNTLYCVGRDNWVDACYELVLKLHELNLL